MVCRDYAACGELGALGCAGLRERFGEWMDGWTQLCGEWWNNGALMMENRENRDDGAEGGLVMIAVSRRGWGESNLIVHILCALINYVVEV